MLCTQYRSPIFLGFAGGTEPRSEGRSIKKCQPVPPDVAAWHRSRDKRGLSLSFSHSCRRLSKSGSNAAASDVNSANWLIEKTISLPTSACRSRKHAAKLPSPSGPCRREGAVHLRHARPLGRLAASHERTSSHSSRRIFPNKAVEARRHALRPLADDFPLAEHKYGSFDPIRAEARDLAAARK